MKFVTGNLWTHPGDWRVVTTNGIINNDGTAVMGAGVALEAAKRYKKLPSELADHLLANGNVLGVFPQYGVITLPTKEHWRDSSPLELIDRSCAALATRCRAYAKKNETVVSVLPGTGKGGLTWRQVYPILRKHFNDVENITFMAPKEVIEEMESSILHLVLNVRNGLDGVEMYIGRKNPRIPNSMKGSNGFWGNPVPLTVDTPENRAKVLIEYYEWLKSDHERAQNNLRWLHALKDVTLGCWCAPKLCHGVILAALANHEDGEERVIKMLDNFKKELNK